MDMQLRPIMTANGSFEKLRQGGYLYVDKTAYLHSLVRQDGNMFFLSRPRRFGKTLTVSTLEAIFQGKRKLFKGLYIDSAGYDWKAYPIIHIDFGKCDEHTAEGLEAWLRLSVRENAEKNHVFLPGEERGYVLLDRLIQMLGRQGNVVVLIDEYDKVLSDNIFSPEVEKLRQVLGGFYQILKADGNLLRFAFITGVTRFARLSVFSQMNNLLDLTLDPDFATMLGYTQEELESCFAGYVGKGLKDTGMEEGVYLARIRDMYDGYRFAPGSETVYNPVSVGMFFTRGHGTIFEDYWIETGGTKLVMDMARSVDLDVTEDLKKGMAKRSLSTFDIAELSSMKGNVNKVQAFLLQTGYLTIDRADDAKGLYYLRMPNREVEESYSGSLLERLRGQEVEQDVGDMCDALKAGHTKRYMEILSAFLSGIPYLDGRRKEADYALVMAALMRLMRRQVTAVFEDRTSEGRIDLSVVAESHIYVMEYKVDEKADAALRQIKEKHYAEKFRLEKGKTIHLLGIAFSSVGHTIQDWKEELSS